MALKLCGSHSHDLRRALERKDLWKHCKPERAAQAMQEWLNRETTPKTWDPYVGCVCEINGQATKLTLVTHRMDKEECPLCCVNVRLMNQKASDSWIDNVTDALRIQGITNGIVHP